MNGPSFLARGGAALAIGLLAGCGGGSSPSSPSYPAVKGIYGTYAGTNTGYAHQRWIAADGTVNTVDCMAVTSIPTQNGASFSGAVDRLAPCLSQGAIAGTIAMDSTLEFTLTQQRWGTCTATAGGQYTGVVNLGSLLAKGSVTVRCDDGSTMTVEEQITGSLPTPPTTPG